MRKQYSTVSFKGQIIYVGIDVHKKQWAVAVQHCGRVSETFTMDPAPEKLAEHLKQKCLKELKRERIQENIQSVPGIGFRTAIALQAELWDMKRFKTDDHLNSYVGLAPHTFGSGEDVIVKCGNRKKKQLHYLMVEAAWRAVRHNLEYKARYGALVGRG